MVLPAPDAGLSAAQAAQRLRETLAAPMFMLPLAAGALYWASLRWYEVIKPGRRLARPRPR